MSDKTTRPDPHCLASALYYASAWSMAVFPANPVTKVSYKAARFSNGIRWGATRSREQILKDFKRWPEAAVCLPTGTDNGFFVVEADTLEGHGVDGIANLQKLINGREWPATRMARSPSGSMHYYFKNPDDILIHKSESEIAQGVDVLGEGGMVLAPPSVKPGVGEYIWVNELTVAEAPQWLLDLVTKKERKRKHSNDDNEINVDMVIAALDAASNANVDEDQWYRIMAAAWRGSDGHDAAFDAFVRWSARSSKHNIKRTEQRWNAFDDKPPSEIGVGTLYQHANDTAPGWREAFLEEALAKIKEQYAELMAAAFGEGGRDA
jgi:hypothetical protein